MNIKTCRNFSFYSFDSNNDGNALYRSFRFVYLGVCIIGTLYLSLNNSYEYNTSAAIQFNNVNSRTLAEVSVLNSPSLGNENLKNHNVEDTDNMKSCCQNDDNTNNEGNKNNESEDSTNNIDNRRQLTKQQLHDELNTLTSIPSNEDLLKLWKQTIDVCTQGLQSVRDALGEYKKQYGEGHAGKKKGGSSKDKTDYHKEFDQRLSIHQDDYTSKFKTLIEKELTVEELRSFILKFLGFFHNLIDYLFQRYKIKYMQVGMSIPTEGTIDDPKRRKEKDQKKEVSEENRDENLEKNVEENPEGNPEGNPEETKKKKHKEKKDKKKKHKEKKDKKKKHKKEDVEENHKENPDENPEENIEKNQE
ncbi:Plasmodium exported protein (PHISTa), unknown function [Plasmodium sp. DRC-Itaito]|nr:Plasmodium exported protein (PHISTa), unknown function [Plasmodium sp. DRC-Itaito]